LISKTIKINAMKSIPKILLLFFMTFILPFSIASGQDKKTEKKVKVIISDNDGTKTVIDTTFSGETMPGSITLKDGKIIYFDSPGSVTAHISSDEAKKNIYITTTVDDDGEKSNGERVIIMSGDNLEWTSKPSTGTRQHIYITTDGKGEKGEKTEKHVIVASAGGNAVWEDKEGKTFHVTVDSDKDSDIDNEMTKYVIARDGIVVTVESNDEARAKEVIKAIESKLDIKK